MTLEVKREKNKTFINLLPGHTIEEIRSRALDNIVSKYDLGFGCDCDAVKKELIMKLFNWFSFETVPQTEKVLDLLLRLLKVFIDHSERMFDCTLFVNAHDLL